MNNIYDFLNKYSISYQKFVHPAVYTCEEAERLCPEMPGESIKNLFLRDKDGKRHFLVVVGKKKSVDLKNLSKMLRISKLSFASPERLQNYLGVEPGAVTMLGVINDTQNKVEVVIDENIWEKSLQCHPLVNTATLVISNEGIKRFLEETKHNPLILDIPERLVS